MTCIKKVALTEPLVDCVEENQVVTDEVAFFSIDILKVTKEELDFARTFTITRKLPTSAFVLTGVYGLEVGSCAVAVDTPAQGTASRLAAEGPPRRTGRTTALPSASAPPRARRRFENATRGSRQTCPTWRGRTTGCCRPSLVRTSRF